jgi:hypothetical protein
MENIKMTQKGDILTIEIDTSKRGKTSTSGKSVIVASTSGNISVPGKEEVKIGINCYVAAGK